MYNTSFLSVLYDGRDITRLVQSVSWGGDVKKSARYIDITLINTAYGEKRHINIEEGKSIVLHNNEDEIFRGVIFEDGINSTGIQSLRAYDGNVYLQKNKDTRKFTKKKASSIIKQLCADYGIRTGEIADTGFVIPKLIARNKTLYEIIQESLDITYKQVGRKFYLTNERGNLILIERANNTVDFYVKSEENLLSASYSKSIEDTKTQIKVVAGDIEKGKLITEVTKSDEIANKFGVMQHVEEVSTEMTASERKQRAQELLKQLSTIKDEARIESLGNHNVRAGVQINVIEPVTELIGTYYVISDTHKFENGSHTMSLVISANDA